MKETILKKLTSRKFVATLIAMLSGIVTMIVGHEYVVGVISGALMIAIPAVAYCIVEGRIDAASVKTIVNATATAVDQLGCEEVADIIDMAGDVVGEFIKDDESDNLDGWMKVDEQTV